MGGRQEYDWSEIAVYHTGGHSAAECQHRFGISNGAWHGAAKRGVIELRDTSTRPRNETREAVARLLESGSSQAAVARELGVSKPTVSFHARRLGVPPKAAFAVRYDWPRIRRFYEVGHSAAECRREFGFSVSAWADAVRRGVIVARPRLEPIDQVLASGRFRCRQHVKKRLMMAGLKEARCECCGLVEWRERPLSLELHHLNGDGEDNRLENLAMLCPNCHSQTDTWGARNKGRRRDAA